MSAAGNPPTPPAKTTGRERRNVLAVGEATIISPGFAAGEQIDHSPPGRRKYRAWGNVTAVVNPAPRNRFDARIAAV